MPPDELIPEVRARLRDAMMAAIMKQDYDEAARLQEVDDRLSIRENDGHAAAAEHHNRVRIVTGRIATASQKLTEAHSRWAVKVASFEAQRTLKLEGLKAKQDQELLDFETRWSDPANLAAFNKPSGHLLQIRKQQMAVALTGDWTAAKELKKRGDELERLETTEAQRRATESMMRLYRNMVQRHARELDHAQMNWGRQFRDLESERDAEFENAENYIKQLEFRRRECVSARRGRALIAVRPAAASARTKRQVRQFRNGRQQEKLELVALNVGSCPRNRPVDEPRRHRIAGPPRESYRLLNC
jgi:hypothetical protein